MGVLYSKIPETIKKEIVDPYISIKDSEARISLRIKDSLPELKRDNLIKQINYDLENKLGLKKDEFKLAGVLILFNNLLQSLFKSQILTLGFVMIGIFSMFFILFKNIKLSFIGIVPNFIAALFILGIIFLLNYKSIILLYTYGYKAYYTFKWTTKSCPFQPCSSCWQLTFYNRSNANSQEQ